MKPVFVKPDPIKPLNLTTLPMKGSPMNYIDQIEESLERSSFITALKTIANWCNGNLMAISRMRLKNYELTGDKDTPPTIDNEEKADETDDKNLEDQTGITFPQDKMTLIRQGSLFASIRQYCFDKSENMSNLTEYDHPQNFKDYIEGRIVSLKTRAPTDIQIRAERKKTLGITMEEARQFVARANEIQAEALENDKDNVISCDSDYESSIDIEEAIGALSLMQQHRLRAKMVDGLMFRWDSLQKARLKAPMFPLLTSQQETVIADALICEKDMHAFEKLHKVKLNEEMYGSGRELVYPSLDHSSRLEAARADIKQRFLIEEKSA